MQTVLPDLRIFRPLPELFVFYAGRVPGVRLHSDAANWLDDGAFSLGTASFAIVDGDEALVYDPQMCVAYAQVIRRTLHDLGYHRQKLVLSHWHNDHVAGNAAFADGEIIANHLTLRELLANRETLESDPPPITPLILPNRLFEGEMQLKVGAVDVILRQFDIHSCDGTALLLPARGILLAGDALEDSVTYVSEPERITAHLLGLEDMQSWSFDRILPNHGDPELMADLRYDRCLITATQIYTGKLLRLASERTLAEQDLQTFAAESFATGGARYFEPYEAVHRSNVQSILAA